MREIEFRIFNTNESCVDHQWAEYPEHCFINCKTGKAYCFNGFADKVVEYDDEGNYVVEQYTGIKDKHGKKIFVGDKVNIIFKDGTILCVIKHSDYYPQIEMLPIDEGKYGRYCHFSESNESQLEVVGTIHNQ